jgi:hypothetical protein
VVLLAAGSTVTVAAASGAFDSHHGGVRGPNCVAPALPGATVSVRLADRHAMMTRGGAMMRALTSPTSVAAGVVPLKVTNTGHLTHELVVLPLPSGQQPGSRTVGSDGEVDETGSLGEVSATCRAGEGARIAAGSTG